MQINVNVALNKGENLNDLSADEAANAIIKALGGDEEKDYCTVSISLPEPGTAGTPPQPQAPFFVQQGPIPELPPSG